MTAETQPLVRIAQFGAIKVIPGLLNIAIIPILHAEMGASGFGAFSIFLGYALLSITVLGAVVTQPMYRFLATDWNSLTNFNAFALITGLLGSVSGFVSAYLVEWRLLEGCLGALFVFSAITYTALTVRFQIQGAITRLVVMEASRVAILFAIVLIGSIRLGSMEFVVALTAFWLSYFIPLFVALRNLQLTWPDRAWLGKTMRFGYLSAIWLLLAGMPLALSKSLIAGRVGEIELGAFTANLDMYYRIFSILNIAITMWAFPAMSKAYDSGDRNGAARIQNYALLVYAIGGLSAIALACLGAVFYRPFPVAMHDGMAAFTILISACFVWQAMSLAHKPLEMSRRLHFMVAAIALSFLIFLGVAWILLQQFLVPPSVAVSIGLGTASIAYILVMRFLGFRAAY